MTTPRVSRGGPLPRRWVERPFAPRRSPVFYGWIVLAVCTVGTICSVPGQTIGVGVFTNHLMEALGLSRTQLSTAYMFGTIASSFLLPYAGGMLDRLGARVMVVVSAGGLGLSLVGVAAAGRLPSTAPYLATMAIAVLCFLAIRFFGQGALTMTSRVTIGKWFNYRRGLATAITSVFVAFSFNSAPQLLNKLVEVFGWQGAALVMAGVIGIGMSTLGWLLYRDNPEECGLVMDGIQDQQKLESFAKRVPETWREFTRAEALKTAAFWVFSMGGAAQALLMTAVSFHIASIGAEKGMAEADAFALFLPTAFFAVPTTIVGGWLSDRIRLKWLLLVMLVAQATFMSGLLDVSSVSGRALFTVGYGMSGGLFGLLITVTWPRYFGREHLGAISGLNMSILVFASAIGPVLFSRARDITGSFMVVTALCWLMPVICIAAALFAENPQRHHAPAGADATR